MVVRNPLERLLSCYRDKFENANKDYYYIRYGERMVRTFREKPREMSKEEVICHVDSEFLTFNCTQSMVGCIELKCLVLNCKSGVHCKADGVLSSNSNMTTVGNLVYEGSPVLNWCSHIKSKHFMS